MGEDFINVVSEVEIKLGSQYSWINHSWMR